MASRLLSAASLRRRMVTSTTSGFKSDLASLPALGALPTGCFDALLAAIYSPLCLSRRFYRHRGVLKLHCSECRYVVRKWHVPILAVDCNANPRHKQALTNPPIRSRWSVQFPAYLAPWIEGKQYPRNPCHKSDLTFQCYS